MTFSEVLGAVREAWAFAWPPLVLCAVAYLVARFFNRSGTHAALSGVIRSAKVYGTKLEDLRSILEPYGLTKLIPVVFLVLIVWLMFLLNGPLRNLVRSLPPYVSWQPDLIVLPLISEEELILLIRNYPTATDFNDLYYLAIAENEGRPSSDRVSDVLNMDVVLKFAAIVSVLMFFISIKQGMSITTQLGKLALILIVLSMLWLVVFVALLHELQQEAFRDWREVRLALQESAEEDPIRPQSDKEQEAIDELPTVISGRERWWRIYFINDNSVMMLRDTLFLPPIDH